MIRAKTSHYRSTLFALAALALVWGLAPGSAGAATGDDSALSLRLQRLAEAGLPTAPPAEQAEALSLATEGPGSLLRRGQRIVADVRFESGALDALGALRRAGASVVHASDRYQTVTVSVPPSDLSAVGAVPGVESVTEVLAPVTAATCPSGIVSEGDAQLDAATARAAFGVDGAGVTVGILSDSFDQDPGAPTHAAQDIVSGDLPGPGNPCGHPAPVNVLENFVPFEPGEVPGDEGRAMAQIVHDLAPASTLAFASAFNGELAFAAAIEKLAQSPALGGAGAKVIVDDVGYFAEPFFQNGPVGVAVDKVTAAGVSYFSAAGNDNLIDSGSRDIASWEAPAYRPTTCPASLLAAYAPTPPDSCMDFDPSAGSDNGFGITVEEDETLTLDLQWAEAWNGVGSDLDAFLLDSSDELIEVDDGEGGEVPAGGYGNNVKSQRPVEVFQWENDTGADAEVRLMVARCTAVCNSEATPGLTPRLKFVLLQNGGGVSAIEYPQSSGGDVVGPAIYGHAGAAGAITTGAVRFNNGAAPEPYSSRGPVTHYFGPVSGVAPAAAIAAAAIAKPDLAATDCGATSFFAQLVSSTWRFCGTSAAAPHAAAVAALIRQANPAAGQAQVRAALTATARPVGAFGPTAVGAGLIDARAAVGSLALPPTVTITKAPAALSNVRRPTIEFSANRPVAFTCQLDGRAQPCASPITVPVDLADGRHGFAVQATDLAGRVGSSGVVSFAIDTTAPRTFLRQRPRKVIRTGKRRVWGTVAFGSNEAGVSFICKFDRDLPRYCPARIKRRFEVGRHRIVVRARDAIGNLDATAAIYKFRVESRGKAKRRGR